MLFLPSYGIKECRQNRKCFGMKYIPIFYKGEKME
ncbi:hypothetical protein BACCAP_00266 [Pseudoflavonifractor capillosus ATCC 29799]|uniref:Uncharacterized protein n=1 Tax=Pseudoflavonifractor capillosus ATCC 29799 TaxID=411467 RepID=A6NPZ7_9FIRM|nr:hypothetical protein BACCAP_00266 [Pseudoflavonifractor capillosus ATCC 29799]